MLGLLIRTSRTLGAWGSLTRMTQTLETAEFSSRASTLKMVPGSALSRTVTVVSRPLVGLSMTLLLRHTHRTPLAGAFSTRAVSLTVPPAGTEAELGSISRVAAGWGGAGEVTVTEQLAVMLEPSFDVAVI